MGGSRGTLGPLDVVMAAFMESLPGLLRPVCACSAYCQHMVLKSLPDIYLCLWQVHFTLHWT